MLESHIQDKRRERRNRVSEAEKAFVELTLTYPKEHIIRKPIIDLSSSGVSFSIPLDEGFLLPGTPIKKISIITKDEFKKDLSGEVRYLLRCIDPEGKLFTKVGLKINLKEESRFTIKKVGNLQIRPQRYCEDRFEKFVQINMPDQKNGFIQGKLLNFSEFGLAFEIDDISHVFMTSEVLPNTKVFIENETIYDGPITIKSIRTNGKKLTIGASVLDQLVNMNKVFQIRTKASVADEFENFLKELNVSNAIKQEFKSIIADTRLFLENVKSWLVNKENARSYYDQFSIRNKEDDEIILRAVTPIFSKILNQYHKVMYEIVSLEDEISQERYKHFYRKQLHDLFLVSPIIKRVFLKPYGYAGDFETINMLLGEPYIGENLYAKLISGYSWQVPTAQGHRNRLKYLVEKIREQVQQAKAVNRSELKILSVGSGPAKEFQELINEYSEANYCNVTFIDFDSEALLYSQEKLFQSKIQNNSAIKLNFINKAVINIICEPKNTIPNQDFIYCAGLFDYLTTATCVKLLKILYQSLNPGGVLMASNVHTSNKYSTFMELAGEWYVFHRSEEDMSNLFSSSSSVERKWVEFEETKTNVFLWIKKKP